MERTTPYVSVILFGLFLSIVAGGMGLLFVSGVEPVAADNTSGPVNGSVELDVSLVDDEVELGTEQTLDVEIYNDGKVLTGGTHPDEVREQVTRAESTDVYLASTPYGVDVRTDTQRIGDLDSGETAIESFDIYVDDDEFDPGDTFDIAVVLDYENVTVTEYERVGDDVDVETDSTEHEDVFYVTVEVEDEVRFELVDTDHDVQVDETGTFTVEMEHTGSEDATDAVVTAESNDAEITFGSGTPTSDEYVGDWDAGDTQTVTFRTSASDDALTEPYPIDLTVEYEDEDGDPGAETTQTSLEPIERQHYVVEEAEHNVSIGDDGILDVELTNEGPQDLTDATIQLDSGDPAITFPESDTGAATTTSTFVGDWEADETRTVSVRTEVGEDAIQRNYTMEATVEARNEDDNELNSRTREFGFEPHPKQRYTVEDISHEIPIGDDGLLEIELKNRGPQDVTAAEVELSSSDADIGFGSGTTEGTATDDLDFDGAAPTPVSEAAVGDWAVNETVTLVYRVDVSDDAVEREYPLEATVSAHDENDSELGDRDREIEFEPLPKQRYTIEDVTHDVAVGDEGVLELEITNEGPLDVHSAAVDVNTRDSVLVFGSGGAGETIQIGEEAFETPGAGESSSEAYVGDWEAGETRTVAYYVSATDDALSRNYTVDATVNARDGNDDTLNERVREFGFEPMAEQTFRIENTDNTLRVGEDGDVVGSVTNDGERTAENVVVLLASESSNVLPRETEYAIGSLEPGETEEFTFRIGISQEAEAGPRVFEFETRYRSPGGSVRLDDSQDLFVDVQPKRDAFATEAIDATFEPGDSGTVEIALTNNRDEPVENVRAKVFPDSPVSSTDDEAFVSRIEPGESATMAFDLGIDSGAMPKEYPVSLDVRYDDERDETQLSGTYQIPIEVTEPTDDGPSLLLVGVVLLLLGGVLVYFRERITQRGQDLRTRLGEQVSGERLGDD